MRFYIIFTSLKHILTTYILLIMVWKNNKNFYLKCFDLTHAVLKEPFTGIGKPEHLKKLGGNVWSRRVNHEHRMVYEVFDSLIVAAAYRYHY